MADINLATISGVGLKILSFINDSKVGGGSSQIGIYKRDGLSTIDEYTGKIYKILKKLDFILLATGFFVILFNHGEFSTFIISFSIWMFALIEWVNYYQLQLSYSLNPAILWRYIRYRKLKKSKIAKEIEKIL